MAQQMTTARCFALAGLLIALASGCQSARIDEPVVQSLKGDDLGAQMEFWHKLADRPITSNDDALHGLLLYLDDADPSADYQARVATLRSRGFLPTGFDRPANEAVTRGTLAVAIAKSLQIKGGLLMHLSGVNERYATRELVYLNIYPPSSTNQSFSGSEFLGIIGKMEDYQRFTPVEAPAKEMPRDFASPAAPSTQQ